MVSPAVQTSRPSERSFLCLSKSILSVAPYWRWPKQWTGFLWPSLCADHCLLNLFWGVACMRFEERRSEEVAEGHACMVVAAVSCPRGGSFAGSSLFSGTPLVFVSWVFFSMVGIWQWVGMGNMLVSSFLAIPAAFSFRVASRLPFTQCSSASDSFTCVSFWNVQSFLQMSS